MEGGKEASLDTLADDLVVRVLEHVSLGDVGRMAAVCKQLRKVVRERKDLWAQKVREIMGENASHLSAWPKVQTYRVLCKFLAEYSALLGIWAGDVQPRGQLLRVEYEDGCLVGRRYVIQLRAYSSAQNLDSAKVFSLEPVEKDGKLTVRCNWFRRPHAGLNSDMDGVLEDDPPAPPSDGLAVQIHSSKDKFELIRPILTDIGEDVCEDAHRRFREYIRRGLLPPERWPRYTLFSRIKTVSRRPEENVGTAAEDECTVREGLYWASYGFHGAEILEVYYEGDFIIGRKVIGDPNVPCGKVSFSVKKKGQHASQVPSRTLNVLSNLFDAPSREIEMLHHGTGRLASEFYRNPETVIANMLQYADGNFAMLFSPYGLVLDFKPLELP